MDVELCDLTVDVSLRFTKAVENHSAFEKNANKSRDSFKELLLPCIIPQNSPVKPLERLIIGTSNSPYTLLNANCIYTDLFFTL